MNLILYFSIALVLSFLGSLPIGLITLTITQKTIQNGRHSGLMIALGATIMEFIYAFIALLSLDLFTQNTSIGNYIKIFATAIFLAMGFYFLWKKNSTEVRPTAAYNYFDFLRGFIVGTMNLLIVPFWIFLGIWLKANGVSFKNNFDILIFSSGAALGALLAFFGYILLSEFIVKRTKKINQYTNKAVGILFLGLGIFQLAHFF